MEDRRSSAAIATPTAHDAPRDSAAFVAGNDTSLVGERAAARGRGATESRDEHAGVKRGFSFVRPPTERLRRTTRPGTRTLVNDLPADVGGCAGWRHVGATPPDPE